ncbi:hypothetical protein GX50_08881 [[Emmonsia] crescens]|uniref:Uncharacterized protein n=1 Tax=[Emmonsia] crescens TaxID=73230 RepID=A0A2B7Z5T4_9EURO|nr:hypothetical protein GX50_08881 [Emmonsia crescens]
MEHRVTEQGPSDQSHAAFDYDFLDFLASPVRQCQEMGKRRR